MKHLTTSCVAVVLALSAPVVLGEDLAKSEAYEKDHIGQQQFTPLEKTTFQTKANEAFASLRKEPQQVEETVLSANKEMVLDAIKGNTMALEVEIDPQEARWVQVSVLRSPDGEEETTMRFYNFDRRISIWYATQSQLVLDTTYSSQSSDVWIHPPQKAIFSRRGIKMPGEGLLPAEPLKLRVVVDRNVVGVLANERLFMAARVSPERADSVGVSLKACGQDAVLKSLKAWQMKSIWP